jgi:hypothetical protein
MHSELKTDPIPKNHTAGAALTSLQHLLSHLMHIRMTRTIERNLLMVESAQAALSDKNEGGDVARMWRLCKTGIGLTAGFIGSHTVTHNYTVYTLTLAVHYSTC